MDIQNGKIEIISFVANIFLANPPSSLSLFSGVRVAQTLVILHGVFFSIIICRFLVFIWPLYCYPLVYNFWFTHWYLSNFFFNIFEIVYLQQIRPLLKLDRDNYFKCFTWSHHTLFKCSHLPNVWSRIQFSACNRVREYISNGKINNWKIRIYLKW